MSLLLFNLSTLESETQCNPEYMVAALKMYYEGVKIPKSSLTKYKPITKDMVGSSFLVHPDKFFKDTTTDIIFRAQYIRLAGRRDLLNFKYYGTLSLDLSFFSDIDISSIKYNPLIEISNKQINFKYEI